MKMHPVFEENGTRYFGSDSYEQAYFDTEIGVINFLEVIAYYDLPLICFFQHENGQKYLGSADGRIFSDDPNREWAYILVPLTEQEYNELQNDKVKINVPFETAEKGLRIVCKSEREQDSIQEVDPSDYEQYHHELGSVYLKKIK